MLDFIKKNLKDLLLVTVYTVLGIVIYVIWFESLWHLWFVDVITGLVILGIGITIGYFYIKGQIKEREEKEKKDNPEVIENKAEETENSEAKDGE